MLFEELTEELNKWVTEKESNGIKQHDQKWHDAKINTIGGSSIWVIIQDAVNSNNNVYNLICQKVGLSKFYGSLATRWGNLFEEPVKKYVEFDKKCTIVGEDLFVEGPPCTSYSPDGLTVMDKENPKIVLVEFKCPFSRIPTKKIVNAYQAQVKMGLDLLELPTEGLLIEAIFRRCTWEMLGYNSEYDKQLTSCNLTDTPVAYGFIGFYIDEARIEEFNIMEQYNEIYCEIGDSTNNWMCNDLGDSPKELFSRILELCDNGVISPWYSKMATISDENNTRNTLGIISNDIDFDELDKFSNFCAGKYINIGIMPWKLMRVIYRQIEKETGYLAPWLPKITELMTLVDKCNSASSHAEKTEILNDYMFGGGDGFTE